MPKLAQLPANDRAPETADANARRVPRLQPRYFAFLSYSHKDKELADWLHRELERFRVPRALAGRLTENGIVPRRLTPIFRDEHDLAAAGDLGGEIKAALAVSQYLIVLCSPTAAVSRWTNAEIEWFKRDRPEGGVLAAIAAGEPFASEVAGREKEECFPPALRQKYDRRGRATGKRAEPLAADFRIDGEARRTGFLKLVAGMLGVGLDELVQRETTRRHRRLAWLAAASVAGMAATSTLAFTAFEARNAAREQRREAEGLVAYMVGDLKDKLEPIGRLDALDGVGSRVLAYYQKQDPSDLPDSALLQRARALSLLGQVANLRGNLDRAAGFYREAMTGTAEAIRRNAADPQRLYDHAQNVFWMADIARQRGDLKGVEAYYRQYKELADRMVSLDPNNMKWRMEQQDADANLGIALYNERQFPEAAARFSDALRMIDALATADPRNRDYQDSLIDTLGWVSDSQMANGRLDDAIAVRLRQIQLIGQRLNSGGADVQYRQRLVPTEQGLGRLYAMKGLRDPALQYLRTAVADSGQLLPVEPSNTFWREQAFRAQLALADYALTAGARDEAASHTNTACDAVRSLLAKDDRVPARRAGLAECEMMQARIALATGALDEAAAHSQRAIDAARSVGSNDSAADGYRLAKACRIAGDARRAKGDAAGAFAAWSQALASLPQGAAERPLEMEEHATILQRLGRAREAQPIVARLNGMSYRRLT
jgi:tetratricopeptide (TPR) repeat protein